MRILFRLIGVIAFTNLIGTFAISSVPQDNKVVGCQFNIMRQDPKDTSSILIRLDEIKSLPIRSIELPDHKTKVNITWEGVYLKEVVQKFLDIDWEKIHRLVITAPDGYSSVVSGLRMKQAETALCTFAMQNKQWPEKFGYLRIIFPDLHEMHWMNNPSNVELILKENTNEQQNWNFYFFDSPVFDLIGNKQAEGTTEWSVDDILTALDCTKKGFAIFTSDGQVREYLFDEVARKMKFAPDSSGYWKIRGERIPIGFRLRKIFFVYSENVGLFTKFLTPEEQPLWQRLFASIHPLTNEGFSARQIFVLLASGERIPSFKFEQYQTRELSLYQLLKMERETRDHLIRIEVIW